MKIRTRRPRFGDPVLLGADRYKVTATAVAPTRGYWIRPAEAGDAGRDRFLSLLDWGVLVWDTERQRWEAA